MSHREQGNQEKKGGIRWHGNYRRRCVDNRLHIVYINKGSLQIGDVNFSVFFSSFRLKIYKTTFSVKMLFLRPS